MNFFNFGGSSKTKVAPPASAKSGSNDMPGLEDISDNDSPSTKSKAASKASTSKPAPKSSAKSTPTSSKPKPSNLDELPALENISSDDSDVAPPKKPNANFNRVPINQPSDSDDDVPPLEHIPTKSTSANNNKNKVPVKSIPTPSRKLPDMDESDDDLPSLEEIEPTVVAASPSTANSNSSPTKKSAIKSEFKFTFPKAAPKVAPKTASKTTATPSASKPAPTKPTASTSTKSTPAPTTANPSVSFQFPASVPAPAPAPYSEMPSLEDISDDNYDVGDPPIPELRTRPAPPRAVSRNSDDDLPELESIPGVSKPTPKKKAPAPVKKATPTSTSSPAATNSKSSGGLLNAYDDMPNLEGISSDDGVARNIPDPVTSSKANKNKKKKAKARANAANAANAANPNSGLPTLEDIDSDDDLPTMQPITAKAKAQAAASRSFPAPAPSPPIASQVLDKGKGPATLTVNANNNKSPTGTEEVVDLKGKGKAPIVKASPKPPTPKPLPVPKVVKSSSDEGMPGLESSEDSDTESEESEESESEEDEDDEDDDEDEDNNDQGGSGNLPDSTSNFKEADDYDYIKDGVKKEVGNVGDSAGKAGNVSGAARSENKEEIAVLAIDSDLEVDSPVDAASSADEEEDDENDSIDWDEDEEDDDDDDEEDSDEDVTYKDGLPADPLLPIMFSRPFMHAARQKLYRNILLKSPYQASLLLRSLSAPTHAARLSVEDLDVDENNTASLNSKNSLAQFVRELVIEPVTEVSGDISGGRGGANVYVEIITLCTLLDKLYLSPTFLKSMTKPLLTALEGLSRLKTVVLASGIDETKPLLFTTARITRLMHDHWPELEHLLINRLVAAEEGPLAEEDEMWMRVSTGEEEDESNKVKRKGLSDFELLEPDASYSEISLILVHSTNLQKLAITNPSIALDRYGLASIILKFGSRLTDLTITVNSSSWHPRAKPSSRPTPPIRPKNYVAGTPTPLMLNAIDNYVYFLDAVLPYLPHLVSLSWDGELASTSAFSFFPVSLNNIKWAHCSAIHPLVLSKLLRKEVNRTRTIKNADGTTTSKTIKTIVARGLKCIRVDHDPSHWSDPETAALKAATAERHVCLHLNGGPGGNEGEDGGFEAALGGLLGMGMVGGLGLMGAVRQ